MVTKSLLKAVARVVLSTHIYYQGVYLINIISCHRHAGEIPLSTGSGRFKLSAVSYKWDIYCTVRITPQLPRTHARGCKYFSEKYFEKKVYRSVGDHIDYHYIEEKKSNKSPHPKFYSSAMESICPPSF